MAAQIFVIKRNKKMEPFMPEKIIKACVKCGSDEKTAKEIAEEVGKKVRDRMPTGVIRNLVVAALRRKNPTIAEEWEKYENGYGKAP